ncbi:putative signal transducing protein [Polaribacter uvawellassae]|uniref:putative signal transducing protein n=1 Tax=Polaribacter uvawellassae TaxID=3133495 RepID=UPI00321A6305
MEKEHIKVFTGTSILINRLSYLLDKEKIPSLIKNHHESARLGGFGLAIDTIELFIYNSDLEKATPIIEDFRKEIAE